MQHRRPRLMAKILAFVLAVSLVFPVSAFASVADLADDTRAPGKSLANTYPNLPVDWQVSLPSRRSPSASLWYVTASVST